MPLQKPPPFPSISKVCYAIQPLIIKPEQERAYASMCVKSRAGQNPVNKEKQGTPGGFSEATFFGQCRTHACMESQEVPCFNGHAES